MKKILLLIAVVFLAASCSKLTDLNVDPNNATTTHPKLLLPTICMDAFERSEDGMYATKKVISCDGENSGQYYKWTRGSFGNYSSLLIVTKMAEEAVNSEAPVYTALAKFFRAYYFYELTMTFGDIPYSEALLGETDANFTPVYDTQEDVFAGILAELEEADAILAEDGTIIDGDIIYDGDGAQWRKLINSFRLKVLMTLSGKTSVGGVNIASEFSSIVASSPLMESNSDNGQLVYLDQEGNRYPEYNASWSGYYMDNTFIERMREREDPRIVLYASQTYNASQAGLDLLDFDSYAGGIPNAPYGDAIALVAAGEISAINSRYRTEATCEPTMIMGYAELQQVLAEAVVRGWISGSAKDYYEAGIRASFNFYETYATGYTSYVNSDMADAYIAGENVNFAAATTTDEQIERIIMQKYIVTFYQGNWDSFYEQRRTGYPEFDTVAGTEIPNRWMYPSSEGYYNSENVNAAITSQYGANNDNILGKPWWLL